MREIAYRRFPPSRFTHHPSRIVSNILTKATVLVLNRNWQAINVRTPQEAFCMMATNVATALSFTLTELSQAADL